MTCFMHFDKLAKIVEKEVVLGQDMNAIDVLADLPLPLQIPNEMNLWMLHNAGFPPFP